MHANFTSDLSQSTYSVNLWNQRLVIRRHPSGAPLTASRFHVLVKFSNWWSFLTCDLPRSRSDSLHKTILLTMRRFLIENSITRVTEWIYEGRVHCVDVYEMSLRNLNFILQITSIEIQKKSYIRFFFFLPISVFKSYGKFNVEFLPFTSYHVC
jgi:hypothetical protein